MTPSTELQTRTHYDLSELKGIAQMFAMSGYFQDAREVSQAFVKIMAGRDLGLGWVQSMTNIHIVKGKLTLGYQAIGALIQRSGKYEYTIDLHTDEECQVTIHLNGEGLGTASFTIADAKQAGIYQAGGSWTKYPRNMLLARALSSAANWYCPEVFGGQVYDPAEMGMVVDADGVIIESTNSGQVEEAAPEPAPEPSEPDPENGAGLTADASGSEAPRKRAPEKRCTCGHAKRSHPEREGLQPCTAKDCDCRDFVEREEGSGEDGGDDLHSASPVDSPSPEQVVVTTNVGSGEPFDKRSPFQVPDGVAAQATIERIGDVIARLVAKGALEPEQVGDALERDFGHRDLKQLGKAQAGDFLGKLEIYEESVDSQMALEDA